MNPIDGDRFLWFLKEQKVKETGAFSKGLNKGLNIAISALKNKEITLPWEVDRVVYAKWIRYHEADIGWDEWGIRCSNCRGEIEDGKNHFPLWYKRCPFCDARMDGDSNEL